MGFVAGGAGELAERHPAGADGVDDLGRGPRLDPYGGAVPAALHDRAGVLEWHGADAVEAFGEGGGGGVERLTPGEPQGVGVLGADLTEPVAAAPASPLRRAPRPYDQRPSTATPGTFGCTSCRTSAAPRGLFSPTCTSTPSLTGC